MRDGEDGCEEGRDGKDAVGYDMGLSGGNDPKVFCSGGTMTIEFHYTYAYFFKKNPTQIRLNIS